MLIVWIFSVSTDNASVGSFGQVEFQEQSSDAFFAQLAKDEREVEKLNFLQVSNGCLWLS